MLAYLEARSLNRTATLALVALRCSGPSAVVAGTTHKVDAEEVPVAQAILRHMWSEARRQWDLFSAPPPRPAPAAATPSPASASALKVVNPLSARRSAGSAPRQLKLVDGALAVEEDRPMVPKGIWSVVDGLTAIEWAWILIQLGTEKAIVAYVDWWIGKARLRSHQLDAVVDYWDAASHRLASEMRLGRTFDEVSRDITGDNLAFSEAMLASRQPAKKNHTTQPNEDHTGEPDDQPKGKAKGKGTRRRPGKRQRTTTGRDGRDQDWEADWPTRRWTRDDRDDDNRRGGR